ncbi:MAG TPA: Spy/CpxP family protein refolding chaperone [Bryobacteraceae bacterium]|nr:Spy/CpxP family protein refolding chaperone [Bryobacteraceae bacterium]
MKKRILSALAFTGLLLAQGPDPSHTPPTAAQMVAHRVARLTTLLTLNTAEQAEATTIFTTEQTALSALMTSMRTARTALRTAVTKNDQAAIATQAAAIGSLTTQEIQAQATAEAAFYAILDTSQQTKFTELNGAGFGGGFGGPGGPGGHGPGGPR